MRTIHRVLPDDAVNDKDLLCRINYPTEYHYTTLSEESAVSFAFTIELPIKSIAGAFPGVTSEYILLIAHLDTMYSAPGANDNAATVIAMLMLTTPN